MKQQDRIGVFKEQDCICKGARIKRYLVSTK